MTHNPTTVLPDARALWTFNEDTRDIECGGAPVLRVYEADDFPCIEPEDRAKEQAWFDAQAQTVVLMLNSLLHDSGDETPLATHSPAPMAGEGVARLILRSLRTRMATACDWTRAGNDHVKVRTADWHVLMEIGERAKDYLAAHPSTQEG